MLMVTFAEERAMEKNQTPTPREPMSDRHPHPWLDAVREPEPPGEEQVHEADEGEELPFDLPRD